VIRLKRTGYASVATFNDEFVGIAITTKGVTQQSKSFERKKMEILDTKISEINRLHNLAQASASDAIEYAKQAGLLLIDAKKRLKHGQFLSWINDNLSVSARQVQRYMAVAHGKTIPLRKLIEKSDTVSHLEVKADQGIVIDGDWLPSLDHHYVHADDTAAFWVVPDSKSKGFHISKLYQTPRDPNVPPDQYSDPDDPFDEREWDGMSRYDGTKHPVAQKFVGRFLKYFGLDDPTAVVWESWIGEGLERPFGEPNDGD